MPEFKAISKIPVPFTVVGGFLGSGKTTLLDLLSRDLAINISVSHTTRERREYEIDGVHYHFITKDEFDSLIADDLNDYISKAVNLAKDIDKLVKLREYLYESVLSSPLFDTKKFSKNFNDILLETYKNKIE